MRSAAQRVEYPESPLAVPSTRPRFSWQLDTDQRGTRQTAYRIDVHANLHPELQPLPRVRRPMLNPTRRRLPCPLTIRNLRKVVRQRTPRSVSSYTDGATDTAYTLRRYHEHSTDLDFRPRRRSDNNAQRAREMAMDITLISFIGDKPHHPCNELWFSACGDSGKPFKDFSCLPGARA